MLSPEQVAELMKALDEEEQREGASGAQRP